jgi:hypothetical protein
MARQRLSGVSNLRLQNLDSRPFLSGLGLPRQTRTFFYLDAHGHADLPLASETEFVIGNFETFAIMIDDFEVPGDAGYTFDDYGVGKRLSLRDFPFDKDNRILAFLPSRPASQESGRRRGCIVLASPDLRASVGSLACLRELALVLNPSR